MTFLQDRRFLRELDNLKIKTQYVKITVLNWKEEPLQQVQGKVISGSINLDGSSSMRRTATLSIVAQQKENDLANVDHLFSLNKKCKLELGIVNTVPNYEFQIISNNDPVPVVIDYKKKYGNIIWFPLGLYVMFNPSVTHAADGVRISMQLKDKMCLLNGDLGGQIHSGIDFSSQEEVTDGSLYQVQKQPTLVYNIIKELANHWGNQPLSKIVISEVPLRVKRIVQWKGTETVYFYGIKNSQTGAVDYYLTTTKPSGNVIDYKQFKQYDDIGFTYEPFTFPGELACNAGDTVTSVLDKIINVLGNYEYFYDVDGKFVFREKQNYLNMSNTAYWTKEQEDKLLNLPSDVYTADTYKLTKPAYSLEDNTFTVNINNTINFNNVKNDFVVWGAFKKSDSNYTSLCRFHLAVDKKPQLSQHTNIIFYIDEDDITRGIRVKDVNSYDLTITIGGKDYEIIAKIGKGGTAEKRASQDWRQELYYQMLESEYLGTDNNTELNNSYFHYYAEIKQQFPKMFELSGGISAVGWKQEVLQNPEQLYYFLDFIDENSELGKFSVNNIGRRSYILGERNDGINCVFEPTPPDVVYVDNESENIQDTLQLEHYLTSIGQRWIQIPSDLYEHLTTGGKLNSCFEQIKDLLYQYTHVNNSISLSTIPIYHLEPGSRITIKDLQSGTNGDFIIQSMTLPLDVSSTMSINAYKALQKI